MHLTFFCVFIASVNSNICCLQVYNEQIRDLLANVGPLAVREDSSKGVVIQGLTLHQVSKNVVYFLLFSFTGRRLSTPHFILLTVR